jgi:hypothetical protein
MSIIIKLVLAMAFMALVLLCGTGIVIAAGKVVEAVVAKQDAAAGDAEDEASFSTCLANASEPGDIEIKVRDAQGIFVGDIITIGEEIAFIMEIKDVVFLRLEQPLKKIHSRGTNVQVLDKDNNASEEFKRLHKEMEGLRRENAVLRQEKIIERELAVDQSQHYRKEIGCLVAVLGLFIGVMYFMLYRVYATLKVSD